jgi:hypothetical protein
MKIAWLCYDDDLEYPGVKILFVEPEPWRYKRIVQIVYAEIKND